MPAARKSTAEPARPGAPPADLAARVAAALDALPRPIGLLGLGEEGRATLEFLRRHGVTDVRAFDRALPEGRSDGGSHGLPDGVTGFGGADYAVGLAECGTVFRSPGVRPDLPELAAARAAGARVTSATRFFLETTPARTVGVTGTVGKGTTVSLIGEALAAAGRPHALGGNLGTNPLAFLDGLTAEHVAVLELSSFQLMDLDGAWPEIAVVLRTSSEHLDWHRDTAEYRAAKARLIAPPGVAQTRIVCADSPGSLELIGGAAADALRVSLEGPVRDGIGAPPEPARGGAADLWHYRDGQAGAPAGLARVALPGRFNLENAAAALLAAEVLGVAPDLAAGAIAAFPGLPHRLERVGTVGPVTCVNDSYATRPEATLGALSAFPDAPLALILGGSEKHADFGPLMAALCRQPHLCRVLLIGATAERMAVELDAAAKEAGGTAPSAVRCADLEAAVAAGLAALPEGGVLLLSPACASFGLFANYKARGERFRELVRRAADEARAGTAAAEPAGHGETR